MFHTNFDDLEISLDNMLRAMKKKQLLQVASQAKAANASTRQSQELREQLEKQAQLLNRIKDHHREIREDARWPLLEVESKRLLIISSLFSEEEREAFEKLHFGVISLINEKRCDIDEAVNELILNRAFDKAQRTQQVKIYKNWTSI